MYKEKSITTDAFHYLHSYLINSISLLLNKTIEIGLYRMSNHTKIPIYHLLFMQRLLLRSTNCFKANSIQRLVRSSSTKAHAYDTDLDQFHSIDFIFHIQLLLLVVASVFHKQFT